MTKQQLLDKFDNYLEIQRELSQALSSPSFNAARKLGKIREGHYIRMVLGFTHSDVIIADYERTGECSGYGKSQVFTVPFDVKQVINNLPESLEEKAERLVDMLYFYADIPEEDKHHYKKHILGILND